jgi:hypothetical protein
MGMPENCVNLVAFDHYLDNAFADWLHAEDSANQCFLRIFEAILHSFLRFIADTLVAKKLIDFCGFGDLLERKS